VNVVLIDPALMKIEPVVVPHIRAATALNMKEPFGVVGYGSGHQIFYQILGCAQPDARFFYSHRASEHFGGRALIVGMTVDGAPGSCAHGVLAAALKDILFLGDVENTARRLSLMARFAAEPVSNKQTIQ
jgi:hypothetical protein